MFMSDILLNHCAYNSTWILDEKTCYYSPLNTPHLGIALQLDRDLYNLSVNFKDLNITPSKGIADRYELNLTIDYIKHNILHKNVSFYLLDEPAQLKQLADFMKRSGLGYLCTKKSIHNSLQEGACNPLMSQLGNEGRARFGVTIDPRVLSDFLKQQFGRVNESEARMVIGLINAKQSKKLGDWEDEILENVYREMEDRYIYKQTQVVDRDHLLVERYFVELANGDAAGCNGFINGYTLDEDFAESKENFYYRRKINIWGDIIKLRFTTQEESPKLWRKMTNYLVKSAPVFDAFRLDNFHNSKIAVASQFLEAAHAANPNLLVMAELFSPNNVSQSKYATQGGVHWMVKEAQNCSPPFNLFCLTYIDDNVGPKMRQTNELLPVRYNGQDVRPLITFSDPKGVWYEQSHDNPALYQKFGNVYFQTPYIALLSFLNCPVGNVRGLDEAWTFQLDVRCRQRYPDPQPYSKVVEDSQILIAVSPNSFDNFQGDVYSVVIKGEFDGWKEGVVAHADSNGNFSAVINASKSFQMKFLVNSDKWIVSRDFTIVRDQQGNPINMVKVNKQTRVHENTCDFRKFFNDLHVDLNRDYPHVVTDIISNDVTVVHRFNNDYTQGYALICGLDYDKSKVNDGKFFRFNMRGHIDEIVKVFSVEEDSEIVKDPFFTRVRSRIVEETGMSKYVSIDASSSDVNKIYEQQISVNGITDNFAIVVKMHMTEIVVQLMMELDVFLQMTPQKFSQSFLADMNLEDINYHLFSCTTEERERYGSDVYIIPNYGALLFAGFYGLYGVLLEAERNSSTREILFGHIEQYDYLMDYHVQRCNRYQRNQKFSAFYKNIVQHLKQLPHYMVARYYYQFVMFIIRGIEQRFVDIVKLPDALAANAFYKKLAYAIPQFLTLMDDPDKLTSKNNKQLDRVKMSRPFTRFSQRVKVGVKLADDAKTSLYPSAGLPFFCSGLMKNWGRDTFTSFKAFFLQTKQYTSAREVILTYAKYMRHGLIPNMLNPSRFNSRDATWWFFKAVRDYLGATGDNGLLQTTVNMVFVSDDQKEDHDKKQRGETLSYIFIDLLQYMIQKHVSGIQYREWNAPDIDPNMNPEGFNIELKVNWESGFVYGGSKNNCLTWMDKVGSSKRSGNSTVPATPRFGAPIETSALQYLAIAFMQDLYDKKLSKYAGVTTTNSNTTTYADWKKQLAASFEKFYWVPSQKGNTSHKIEPSNVQRKGIYKDCYSGDPADYQLRPNALIAIALVPEILNKDNMVSHMRQSEVLLEPSSIGVKTLDPQDEMYRSYYDNSHDSDDFYSALGFSYHNGPEWIWLYGYYIMAGLQAGTIVRDRTVKVNNFLKLSNHIQHLQINKTGSLPELTNGNGVFCRDSCWSQLWSVATVLEAIEWLNS